MASAPRPPWRGDGAPDDDPILAAWGERACAWADPTGGQRVADLRAAGGWETWIAAADPVDAATVDEAGRQMQARIAPADAPARFADGVTICADVRRQPDVARWLQRLVAVLRPFEGDAFAKLYVSPAGAGFAMHFDYHHVVVAQLSGRKRWWYGETPAHPHARYGGKVVDGRTVHTFPRDGWPVLDAEGRPIPAPTRDELRTTVLAPGDLLYLPPGTWHTTQADETSVAVSFSPPRGALMDLVLGELRGRMESDPTWRQDIDGRDVEGRPEALGRALRWGVRELGRVTEKLTAPALGLCWARRVFAADAPAAPGAPGAPLTESTVLAHVAGGFVWLRATDPDAHEDAIVLFRPGVELALPVEAERFVVRLAAAETFSVADARAFEPRWPPEDVTDVLAGLVESGLLQISAA